MIRTLTTVINEREREEEEEKEKYIITSFVVCLSHFLALLFIYIERYG